MRVLTLPIPEHVLGDDFAEGTPTMVFLAELWQSLSVLAPLYPKVAVAVRVDADSSGFIDEASRAGYDAREDDGERGWWICTIHWGYDEKDIWIHDRYLFSQDFAGEGTKVVETFVQLFEYLRDLPEAPVIPEKLQAALAALK